MKTVDPAHDYPFIRIILADDDPDDCFFFQEALRELDIPSDLDIVNNGEELIRHLNLKEDLPDILFLDLNMPKKNGCACLREIRNDSRWKDLFVVMYSTTLDETIIQTLSANGANHFIQKPVLFNTLKRMIRRALEVALADKSNPQKSSAFVISMD
jgi:CheY-like chemotaxis protein